MDYSLAHSYIGESLISGFRWHDGPDLSNGFVSYQNQKNALDLDLYSVDPSSKAVRLGVDSTNKYGLNEGRPSIRLESKDSYQHGLFIADFLHMPPSQCGTWPAFWAYGADWPMGGEIDIIEGANLAYTNVMSGHTSEDCMLDPEDEGLFSGERRNLDCYVGQANIGCGFNPPASDSSSYGDGFNAANGGVYAMEWDSEYIKIWHFPRGAIPADIEAKKPDPEKWGLPQALFGGSKCDVDKYYSNMNIVLNINFCGDYGEGTWNSFATCKALAPTCKEYVANNPDAFENAYWDVSYIDVYARNASIPPVLPPSTYQSSIGDADSTGIPVPSNPNMPNPTGPYATTTPGTPLPNNGTLSVEPTTTTTITGHTTIFVTVPGSGTDGPSVRPLPVAAGGGSANPDRIGNYAYIGCFGSRARFPTFEKVAQSEFMTLERCVRSCDGKTYIGVFEETCYCADKIDADTRAVADESDCDRPCPGNDDEFCGGLNTRSTSKSARWMPVRRDAPNSILLTVYASLSDTKKPELPPAMGPARSSALAGSIATNVAQPDDADRETTVTQVIAQNGPNSMATVTRAIPQPGYLNVTAANTAVADTLRPGVTTTITYFIVPTSDPGALVPQQTVITMWYEQCDCETPRLIAPPMETKVVECDGCGAQGQNSVTLTMPIAVPITTAPPAASDSPDQALPSSDIITRVTKYKTVRVMVYRTLTNGVVETRMADETVLIPVIEPSGIVNIELSADSGDSASTPKPLIPSNPNTSAEAAAPVQPTTPAQNPIPAEPTTPASGAAGTQGAPDQPVAVAGAEWSGMKRVKTSTILSVVAMVLFITFL
ncbi:mixed-linked glucanase precursor MLG1 [Fusarium albosuccineum]|uniref:Mixed-linked glucanase MLG1 n=1 Tax=Fusarium albosuccineum TaxID=1237068 RepID=A0A8H4PHX1_9HYPO|nr:mixed-linked glucanase precursor MLG1 [Fusarium albosuccineum]